MYGQTKCTRGIVKVLDNFFLTRHQESRETMIVRVKGELKLRRTCVECWH